VKDGVTKETQARHQSQPQDGEMGFEQNQFGKKMLIVQNGSDE
jgi:hypothetical protein